jgi:hypothetical protein
MTTKCDTHRLPFQLFFVRSQYGLTFMQIILCAYGTGVMLLQARSEN